MSGLEINIKKNNNNFPKILVRYVDDIFAIVDETFNIDFFHQQINSQYPSIKFTYEKEVDGKLLLLDLLVKRVDNQLKFEIYRKKTHTFRCIHKNSEHHWQRKITAFYNMVYRLVNIPLDKKNLTKN